MDTKLVLPKHVPLSFLTCNATDNRWSREKLSKDEMESQLLDIKVRFDPWWASSEVQGPALVIFRFERSPTQFDRGPIRPIQIFVTTTLWSMVGSMGQNMTDHAMTRMDLSFFVFFLFLCLCWPMMMVTVQLWHFEIWKITPRPDGVFSRPRWRCWFRQSHGWTPIVLLHDAIPIWVIRIGSNLSWN